ncbi:FUSC family protein [Dactylosporangium fulvum]|uniref:FUSC family protein n=1 Tax=Dactylosporangium fulvum TaxID=53359 RepID=A0ABY5VNX6_9ACTN|nr:FUSC family protein [Dactylosporangium fulvum]UWP79442.1 FUSC family protein [Dactylosporangium fulvum]
MVRPAEWLRRRDPDLAVLRRAARTAVVTPAAFGLSIGLIGIPTIATYTAFGCFALLLFADFTGPASDRIRALAALAALGAVFITLGTVVASVTWLATLCTAVIAFVVLFSGVVSSVLAGAGTAMLLPFILSSSLPGPLSAVPERLAGWGIALAASVVAITVLWPAPEPELLRGRVTEVCDALADRLRAEVARALDLPGGAPEQIGAAAWRAEAAVAALQRDFYSTPYRPTGLSAGARALVRLVDELSWLGGVVSQAAEFRGARSVCAEKFAAGLVLRRGAELLSGHGDVDAMHRALDDMAAAGEATEHEAMHCSVADATALDPSFRAQEVRFAVAAIAANIELTVAADRRTWLQRILGWQPSGLGTPLSSARERAAAHLEPHSVWLHNSIRAAAGLALAVLVARLTGVEYSFWVVLGALSVLRSNALATGQTAVRGLLGTFAGLAVGGVIVVLIGTNTVLFWAVLPLAVLFAGLAPATISFAAGQAGFTIALVLIFNIIEPRGWRVGIVRVEDVAIGCAVSLAVGLLFWPRGAGKALNTALAQAYTDSAHYLRAAVDFGISRCDSAAPPTASPRAAAQRAAAANRRLDDAFRTYLGEHGAKPVPLTAVTRLVGGVVGLRLAADAVLDLWESDVGAAAGDRTAARQELEAAGHAVAGWYRTLADAITGDGPVPDALPPDTATTATLRATVERDLSATATAVRMLWTGGHLDAARRLQPSLVDPARALARASA